MNYKLLALDMDGTVLTEQKKISPRTAEAIAKLLKRGVHVVASTGRGYAEMTDYRDVFKLLRNFNQRRTCLRFFQRHAAFRARRRRGKCFQSD